MGRHRDEIWQELRELDNRVTQLEDRAILKPEYDPADVALTPPRPWCVGDVVRLEEANGYNMKFVGEEMTIGGLSECGRYVYFTDGPWPASALTLIRPAAAPESAPDPTAFTDAQQPGTIADRKESNNEH